MPTPIERLNAALAGRYEVEREVGAGGMATVYLARDVKHDRRVAIKILRPELAAALGPDRFPREIRIVAQLQHPHVLPLHDSGETDGFLYYVMPFVEGESLRARLERDGPMPVPEAVRVLREVADALAYAHRNGVLHRDIKPDNVMLSGRHAMVMDFGVAKAVSASGRDKLTTVGVAVGTPTYMSPEQATGEENLDHRSDIYALGILAFELLTGRPPYAGRSAQAILSAHVLEPPPDITEFREALPPALAEVVMRCLQKNPADRWQSADEILQQLESLGTPGSGGITPTTTRPLRVTSATGKRAATPKRGLLIGAGVAVLLVAGAVAGFLTLGGDAPPGPQQMAVMPFTDVSGQDAQLVGAMHSQLIVSLGQIPGATVAPSSAMEAYRTMPKPVAEIANELHVGAILEGNVFRSGQRLRITLQLTDPRSIRQIWSRTFDLDLSGDLFDAIDGVIPQIVDGVRGAVTSPAS